MEDIYTATKTRSGRPGWSVIFRHPLRRDTRGKPGLKIRRGLNTTDNREADRLVEQLKTLLTDRKWWSADRRGEAEREFAQPIVSAFFDGIEIGRLDTSHLRETHIHLPGRDEGYARALLAGTTGAGKTTLLRHMIGSSHEHDRFTFDFHRADNDRRYGGRHSGWSLQSSSDLHIGVRGPGVHRRVHRSRVPRRNRKPAK